MEAPVQPARIVPEPTPDDREALLAALGEAPPDGSGTLSPWAQAGLREAIERDADE